MKKGKLEKGADSISFKKARKDRYKKMADDKTLGNKELNKYDEMRLYLKRMAPELNFPSMQSGPKRPDYNSIQISYREYGGC